MMRSILLVEDNPMDLDLTRRAFVKSRLANPLEVARDGEEALEWIARWEAGAERPILILLDLNLPKVHGLDVLRALKSNPACKSIPVVVLTTSREDADLKAAYAAGVNSYIVKPVAFESFMQVVEQIQLYWAVVNMPETGDSK